MIQFNLLNRYRRAAAGALFAAALALLPACGSTDKRPLVLVDVPLGSYATAGATVRVTVTLDNGQVTVKTLGAADATSGKIGVYLPSDSGGNATVTVDVIDASGCVVASGSSTAAVAVKAGEKSAPVSIALLAAGPCVLDGGASDGSPPPPIDSAVADSRGGDVPVGVDSLPPGADSLPPVLDGSPSSLDGQPDGTDVQALDASAPDAKADVASLPLDAAADVAQADLLVTPDLGPDGPVDAPLTTMSVLSSCTPYTHSKKNSTGAAQDWGIRQLVFSPDGKLLVSFGEDGRAKLWNVTAAGLVEPTSGLAFTGTGSLHGTISPDGNLVAVGDTANQVSVYDLATSIQFGAPSKKWTLPPDSLSTTPYWAVHLQFTSDGGHLIVVYEGDYRPDPNQFVVWDLGTQQIVRLVKYDYDDMPMAIIPGGYTGQMWVASAASVPGDGGDYVSTVTLMDVTQTSPSKAQVSMPGTIKNMVFSPDGTTLAIAFDSGEVSLWDITSKSNIVKLGSPLITGSTTSSDEAYALAYTSDGKYLAAGIFDFTVRLVQLQQKLSLQKDIDYLPWSIAFAPDGLALAVGERDDGVLLYCHP